LWQNVLPQDLASIFSFGFRCDFVDLDDFPMKFQRNFNDFLCGKMLWQNDVANALPHPRNRKTPDQHFNEMLVCGKTFFHFATRINRWNFGISLKFRWEIVHVKKFPTNSQRIVQLFF
jgi:hypothetical protein